MEFGIKKACVGPCPVGFSYWILWRTLCKHGLSCNLVLRPGFWEPCYHAAPLAQSIQKLPSSHFPPRVKQWQHVLLPLPCECLDPASRNGVKGGSRWLTLHSLAWSSGLLHWINEIIVLIWLMVETTMGLIAHRLKPGVPLVLWKQPFWGNSSRGFCLLCWHILTTLSRGFCKMTWNRLGTPGKLFPGTRMHAEIPFSLPVRDEHHMALAVTALQDGERLRTSALHLLTIHQWGEISKGQGKSLVSRSRSSFQMGEWPGEGKLVMCFLYVSRMCKLSFKGLSSDKKWIVVPGLLGTVFSNIMIFREQMRRLASNRLPYHLFGTHVAKIMVNNSEIFWMWCQERNPGHGKASQALYHWATLPDPLKIGSNIVNLKTTDHSVLLGACVDAIRFFVDIQTLHEPKDPRIEVNSESDILLMNKGGKVPSLHYMAQQRKQVWNGISISLP